MRSLVGEYKAGLKNGADPNVAYRVSIDDPHTKLRQAVDNKASALVLAYWVGARDGYDTRDARGPDAPPA